MKTKYVHIPSVNQEYQTPEYNLDDSKYEYEILLILNRPSMDSLIVFDAIHTDTQKIIKTFAEPSNSFFKEFDIKRD